MDFKDPTKIKNMVNELQAHMKETNWQKRKKESEVMYRVEMEEKFPEYATMTTLFKKVIFGEDLTQLWEMLDTISDIKSGKKNLDDEETRLGKKLAEKHLYPSLNDQQRKIAKDSFVKGKQK